MSLMLDPRHASRAFERFVADALEELTGIRFLLARSGDQHGRDSRGTTLAPVRVYVESKFYGSETRLSERELISEIEQVTKADPDLDLWILATTAFVSDQVDLTLREMLGREGRDCLPLTLSDGSAARPSSLELLMAKGERSLLANLVPQSNEEAVRSLLRSVRANPAYRRGITTLRRSILQPTAGYDIWRRKTNEASRAYFQHPEASLATLGSDVAVAAPEREFIRRIAVSEAIEQWWQNWPRERRPLVLIGEEGDGKSWCAADWLSKRVVLEDFPAAIFLTADLSSSTTPSDLLADWSQLHFRTTLATAWNRKIERWARRDQSPMCVLVLDGINERKQPEWWRGFFDRMKVKIQRPDFPADLPGGFAGDETQRSWFDQLAIIITVRRAAWERHREAWSLPNPLPVEVPPFSDAELDDALVRHGVDPSSVTLELRALLAKPRYFNLGIRLRGEIESSGDISPARLILEEWKDRLRRKRPLANFSDRDFKNLLGELATQFRQGHSEHRWHELEELASVPASTLEAAVDELRTGGVFDEASGRLRLRPDYLYCGLGLVLADEVRGAVRRGLEPNEVIAQHLGVEGLDQNASIVETALVASIASAEYPRSGQLALLSALSDLRNTGDRTEDLLARYLPAAPSLWADYAELSLGLDDRPEHGRRLLKAFRRWWKESSRVREKLRPALGRWLGIVCFQAPPWAPEQPRDFVSSRLGAVQAAIAREGADLVLTPAENPNLLALRPLALGIISLDDPVQWLRWLALSVLAEELMGYPVHLKEIQWLLRLSRDSCLAEVRRLVDELRRLDDPTATAAAARLLWAEGSSVAEFEVSAFREHEEWVEEHRRDPCISGFSWERHDWDRCCQRADVDPGRRQREMARFAHDPELPIPANVVTELQSSARGVEAGTAWEGGSRDWEFDDLEACLAAAAPKELAGLVQRIASSIGERSAEDLRHAAFELPKRALLLTAAERRSVLETAERLRLQEAATEDLLFQDAMLFGSVLPWLSADEQLAGMLKLPGRRNLRRFEDSFRPPEQWDLVQTLLMSELPAEILARLLWYIFRNDDYCPPSVREMALRYWRHPESGVRAWALALARSAPRQLAAEIVSSGWSVGNDDETFENDFGSLLVVELGDELPFAEIRHRCLRSCWSYALERRGKRPSELAEYVQEIERWLTAAKETIVRWAGRGMVSRTGLAVLIGAQDEVLTKWANEFLNLDTRSAQQWHFYSHGFFEVLSGVLAGTQPAVAIRLFSRLDEMAERFSYLDRGISLLDYYRFDLPDVPLARAYWNGLLAECKSDRDLFNLVQIAESGNGAEWLKEICEERLSTDIVSANAWALTLLALSSRAEAGAALAAFVRNDGWIGAHAKWARELWQRWRWGRHWFERFVVEVDDVRAHAAWTLFLRCVDRRFWFWRDKPLGGLSFNRKAFLRNNQDELERHIKKNEDRWDKMLFGEDIEAAVAPWFAG